MTFKLLKKSKISQARLGKLETVHGEISTPFFMPCATQGAVKTISMEEMKKLKYDILLANTYHLMLSPGSDFIKKQGGLHKFINWQKPILTDSGGFQVFSLSGKKNKKGQSLVKLTEKGVGFKSYIDGKEHYLTPEQAYKIQHDLGADVAVCLDVCAKLPAKKNELEKAVGLTASWAKKTKDYYERLKSQKPHLFCVIQGGLNKELRLKSLNELIKLDFDGYNIGGLSVGESTKEMYKVLNYLTPAMPENKPRYLMGVGYPENIVEAVKRGVDMFDCVIPTREGRHGKLFLWKKNQKSKIKNQKFYNSINITRAKFKNDRSAINQNSKLPELREYSKAYLHYLFKIKESLALRLASLNNLEFYLELMAKIRSTIKDNRI